MNDVTNLFGPDDPETEERLAGALRREAETVEPSSRLAAIRAEGRRGRTGRVVGIVAAAMVAAVVGGLVVGTLVQRTGPNMASNDRGNEPKPAASSVAGPAPTPETTASSPSSPSASSSQSAGTGGVGPTVPVYWLGADDKLFREFLPPATKSESRAVAAIETMLAGSPRDPDYRAGPWRQATGVKVAQDGEDLTVDLPADALAGGEVSEEVAQQALQQLVYTVTAATQAQGSVTVLIDGKPGRAWDRVDVGEPLKRDVAARATVWITAPQQDDSRKAGTVKIEGSATAFEGNVVWKVAEEDDSVVKEGHTMAGANGTYAGYSFELDLEPGTYVVTVTAPDASGRTDGVSDNKTFTVT